MSKSVIYNIKSKDQTQPGIKSALSGLNKFDQKVGSIGKSLKNALIGGAVIGGLTVLNNKLKDLTATYGVQQKAELLLANSVKNNPLLNGQSYKNLTAYASELQKNSIYGDEQLIQLENWLSAQGRSEAQIKSILQASADLASTGIMPLESAVKNLAKTYAGMTGELGESIPSLNELTKEQLLNGEAVALIAKQYEGYAETLAKSSEGIKTQLDNVKGDIKESLGGIWLGITGDFNSKMLPVFEKVNSWLSDNKNNIINFFTQFPDIAKASFKLSFDFLKNIFSLDFLKSLGSYMWDVFKIQSQTVISTVFNYLKAIGQTIWEPLKYGFDVIIYNIKNSFANVINFFIDKLNALAEGAHNVGQTLLHPLDKSKRTAYTGGIDKILTDLLKPQNNIVDNISTAWKEANENTKNIFSTWIEDQKAAFEKFGDTNSDLRDIFDNYIEDVKDLLETPINVGPLATTTTNNNADSTVSNVASAIGSQITSSGLPNVLSQVSSLFNSLAGGLFAGVQNLSALVAAVNPLALVVKGFTDIVGETINKAIAPNLGMLIHIGEFLGQLLIPVLEVWGNLTQKLAEGYVWVYNKALRPFGNGIIGVLSLIKNGVANFLNSIFKFINNTLGTNFSLINTSAVNWDTLSEINLSSLQNAGYDYIGYSSSSSSGGSTTSYTGLRDINVYVNYNVGISAQDDRDIALKIRDEIKAAEDLGY